ncbi:MAG TPA: hypothetical protein VF257_01660 [Solirubrobacteraceae bacterium]
MLTFEPPARIVFGCDISPQWQIETDLETSEVEVDRLRPKSLQLNVTGRRHDRRLLLE